MADQRIHCRSREGTLHTGSDPSTERTDVDEDQRSKSDIEVSEMSENRKTGEHSFLLLHRQDKRDSPAGCGDVEFGLWGESRGQA